MKYHKCTRVTGKLFTLPSPNGNKRLIHQLEIQLFQGTHCGGWSPFWTVSTKTGRKEKSQRLQGTSTSPSHHHQLPFESKLPFPACFLSVLSRGGGCRWIDDQVKVGEEIVEKSLMYRKKIFKASQELAWTDANQNDSFSDSSYLFPIQRILPN